MPLEDFRFLSAFLSFSDSVTAPRSWQDQASRDLQSVQCASRSFQTASRLSVAWDVAVLL